MPNQNSLRKDHWLDVDQSVEDQLRLQVEIAYGGHHQFMLAHGLAECRRVVDVGTGSGLFLRRLAEDHPAIEFTGLEKREHLLERAKAGAPGNLRVRQADAQSAGAFSHLDGADGVLMRYFLLHVPNAREILRQCARHCQPGCHLWVIDVDLSDFRCEPGRAGFQLLRELVHEFCSQHSVDTFAGQKLGDILRELHFKQIESVSAPFSRQMTTPANLAQFLAQETLLYSHLLGRAKDDARTAEILRFIDSDVRTGSVDVSYGMILWHAVAGAG